ncbi:MAG TPA: hypothetical protein VFY75_07040 [Solirubrobacterales bacterium]|nr:hypothetical protein [Solirubrobacterales bacterium]
MKYAKIFLLLAIAAVVPAALAATATATTITSPTGTSYTGSIHAESEGPVTFHSELIAISCEKSTLASFEETHSNTGTAHGPVTTLDFSECTDTVTVLAGGKLEMHRVASGGTLTSTGLKLTTHGIFGIPCEFTTNNTDIGNLTDSHHSGRTEATLDIDSSLVPRTGDSAFCGGFGEWTGSYTVTTPTMLYID